MPTGGVYTFGPFELDGRVRSLARDGERLTLSDRHLGVLLHLAANAGSIVAKDDLVAAGWGDVAVTDNSLEQAISTLRRLLGPTSQGQPYVETVPRRGYRFTVDVSRSPSREPDDVLEALLAPHRAWIEGVAALETLERSQIVRARGVFADVVEQAPDQASARVGLANACIMQFEMTRADAAPDVHALGEAVHHARDACRLDPQYGEAWATLGFVLERTGHHLDALAASRRAVTLEPDNWRHVFRLSSVAWGEERLRAARRTLALMPGFPLAHWLAATVHVARQAFDEAERELVAGIAGQTGPQNEASRFSGVALHWLLGLVHLARGDESGAAAEFERELAAEAGGHLYARECCANTWYAIGALRLRQGRTADAARAFESAVERVPIHPMARLAVAALARPESPRVSIESAPQRTGERVTAIDAALVRAAALVLRGGHAEAARHVDEALATASPGSAAWLLPVEPLLAISRDPVAWAPVLARLRSRAA